MLRYILKRLASMLLVALIASAIVFFLYSLIPGDRAELMVDPGIKLTNPELYATLIARYRDKLGLDQPIFIQYFKWLFNILSGDLGFSTMYLKNVSLVIKDPLFNTIKLNFFTMIATFLIAIPLGIVTAVKKNSLLDRATQIITAITYSLPSVIVSLIVVFVFAIKLRWFPISGMGTPGFTGSGIEQLLDSLKYMILPITAYTIISLASITRYIRGAMIEVLSQDYIRTARAKGLKEKTVIYVHAFRNALIPVITIVTAHIIGLFGGSAVLESIFKWNGIGNVMIEALNKRDFSISLALIMMTVIISLVAYLIMDLLYMLADPRIRMD